MKRPLIATLLAAALALSPMSATIASAQSNEQLGRFLAGAATLGILGYAYHKDKKHDRERSRVVTRHAPAPIYREKQRRHYSDNSRFGRQDRAHYRGQRSVRIPVSCLRQVRTRHGVQTVIARNCR